MYLSEDQKQASVGDETPQATSTFCTPAPLVITELPPEYTSFQPSTWQYQSNSDTNMEVPRLWETNSIINTHGPTMFDWYHSPVNSWSMQSQRIDVTSQAGQTMGVQAPLFNNGVQESPFEFEKSFAWDQAWPTGHHTQETHPVAEAVPQLWEGPGTLRSNPPESNVVESPGRASKRRRSSSTSSPDGRFAPPTAVSSQPSLVEGLGREQAHGQFRNVATSSFHVPQIVTPDFRSSPPGASLRSDSLFEGAALMTDSSRCILPLAEAASIPLTPASEASPVLTPSVRVISDRRETTTKLRRGNDAVFKTQSVNTKRGHYASEVWESHKPAIKKMYIDEGKPLREVISTMEREHHFPATSVITDAIIIWAFD